MSYRVVDVDLPKPPKEPYPFFEKVVDFILILVLVFLIYQAFFGPKAHALTLQADPATHYTNGTEIPFEDRFAISGQLWASASLTDPQWWLMAECPFRIGQPYRWMLDNPTPAVRVLYFKATSKTVEIKG